MLKSNHLQPHREGFIIAITPSLPSRNVFRRAAVVFAIAYLVLFAGMDLGPNIFDEAIILTGAMRVAAGLIPHQGFYSNYGPAQYYIVAFLFKLFGPSVLIERLYDLFLKALIVSFMYTIVALYGPVSKNRRTVAVWTAIITVLWFFALDGIAGTAVIPVSLLNLIASVLILPIFSRSLSARRVFAAGAIAGISTLFRYDTGVALLGIQAFVIAAAIYLRTPGFANRLRNFALTFWAYLVGFAAITLPAFAFYLSRGPLHPFVHDILIYPSKYYHRGRNLPFPRINLDGIDNIGIYLPVVILAISVYVAFAYRSRPAIGDAPASPTDPEDRSWLGLLITFGALTFVMYLKGIVRVSLTQMYLSILPSLVLIAVLFQCSAGMTRPLRRSIKFLALLSILAACFPSLTQVRTLHNRHTSVPANLWASLRNNLPEPRADWCKIPSPTTKGLCFLPDNDHIQTIEFIQTHTHPGQTLFVGTTRSDIVLENDNFTYFACQRLPATKWSQFDPDLVNRYDIQVQIVRDLDRNLPPYIVIDSEFDHAHEPNDSSKSSGVFLLDDYIHHQYRPIQTFGKMSIWQRNPTS